MPHDFFGNPELLHNNDTAPIVKNSNKGRFTPPNDPVAIQKALEDARNFEELMIKYSGEDKETWDSCIIAAAKLVLYFEFCRESEEDKENPKTPAMIRKFREKVMLRSNNNMEKILELAAENNLTLDSTISVERAAIAYFEYQKNILPRSQPNILLQKSFYPSKYISKTAGAS